MRPLAALIFLLITTALFADELQQAAKLEQQGHAGEAVAAYEKWLASNPNGATWDRTLLHTADLMSNPDRAVAMLADALPKLSSDSARHTAYVKIGQLDELIGNWTGAQESFQNASLIPGTKDFASLLESARLLVQLGDFAEASGQIRSIIAICQDPAIVTEAQVLDIRLDAVSGRTARATAKLRKLLNGPTAPKLSAQSLAELYEVGGLLKLDTDRARLAAMLKENYPKSPELAVIGGKTASIPSPAGLLGFGAGPYDGMAPPPVQTQESSANTDSGSTASSSPTASAGPSGPAGGTIDIQIGSYRDQTNAEYRLQDLKQAGFTGSILKAEVNGKTYYKVVVPKVPVDRSQDVLISLKEKGFEGFLLYDK